MVMMNKYTDAEAADISMVESMANTEAVCSGNDESMSPWMRRLQKRWIVRMNLLF